MTNEERKDFENDFVKNVKSSYANHEKLGEMWAKLEVAKIMMDQASGLTSQVYDDLKFLGLIHEMDKRGELDD
jgi:hypothetical protein